MNDFRLINFMIDSSSQVTQIIKTYNFSSSLAELLF